MLEQAEKVLTVDMLADMLDANDQEREQLKMHIEMPYLSYKECSPERQQAIISEIESELKENKFRVSGSNCNEVWEKGWGEVLEQLIATNQPAESVIAPQYFGKYCEIRLQGKYIEPLQKDFEYQLDNIIREAVFRLFLNGNESIVEIGCGTGNSLLKLRKLYPTRRLIGLDWADASGDILEELNRLNYDLVFKRFNMLDLTGKDSIELDGVTVLSVHALEQLGSNINNILSYLLTSKAKKFVHIEPVMEFYKSGSEFDQVANDYHRKRNYLSGFLDALEILEKTEKITIDKMCRLGFGNRYHEAYNLIIWSVKSE